MRRFAVVDFVNRCFFSGSIVLRCDVGIHGSDRIAANLIPRRAAIPASAVLGNEPVSHS
jgi:hypothetical protein